MKKISVLNQALGVALLALFVGVAFGEKSVAVVGKKEEPVAEDDSSLDDLKKGVTVTYDGRSLMIGGKREMFFSGSIHYPRSTPDMWPQLIAKAKQGGLNVIQTYVFWNLHEPEKGKYNFEGNADLVKFIKMVGEHGLYVTLRLGPFVQAEWNHGGLPYWLREVPGILFRTDNEPFKNETKRYVEKIIDTMRAEKLFAPQGGPIILGQIENEYNTIQAAYKQFGVRYIQWAANLVIGLNTGIPWMMCKQNDAPDPIINSCNGRHCGDNFAGPNKPYKPSLWTENWTAQFRVFGDPPSQRSAEDMAYSVARWFSKNGTLTNYYMYHGGTNFGRTSSAFTATRYYDEAPLDEYGLPRDPKYSHLKDVHDALKLSKKALLWGTYKVEATNEYLEATWYEKSGTDTCVAFLSNSNTFTPATITFRNQKYYLPPRSISILPDCKTVVLNTQMVVSQHSSRNFVRSEIANKKLKWEMYEEPVPSGPLPLSSSRPEELFRFTKDKTDYAWYTTRIELNPYDLPFKQNISAVLRVQNLGHAMLAYVNGEYVAFAHGSKEAETFIFEHPITLKAGVNHITFLCNIVGFPDSGAYMEHRYAGPRVVTILGLNTGTLDLTRAIWQQQAGLTGEKQEVFTKKGSRNVKWTTVKSGSEKKSPVTWYKAHFDAPEGNDPVLIRLTGLGKGMAWVNGINIGRYWVSYLSPLDQPTQTEYHIPRSFLKPTSNLVVLLEEQGRSPDAVEIMTANRDTLCGYITEDHPPHVRSWERVNNQIRTKVKDLRTKTHIKCPDGKAIVAVEFASYGNPYGYCGGYIVGNCTAPVSKQVVEKLCLGKPSCSVPMDKGLFSKNDPCPNIKKALAIQVACGFKNS